MTIKNDQLKWFFYTVILGIFPVFWKSLLYLLLQNKEGKHSLWLDTADIIFFGVALSISNISAIENSQNDQNWKTSTNFVSIFIGMFGSLMYVLALLQQNGVELFDTQMIKVIAYMTAAISLISSLTILLKLKQI